MALRTRETKNIIRTLFIYLKFLGDWYVQEYQYASEIKLRGLSCVGFKFTLNGLGDIVSNFTFRFPPRTGHFYHVATFSSFNEANPAIWDTKFAGGNSFKFPSQ